MKIERLKTGNYILLEDYTSPVFPDVVVPKGWIWDGATIPRILLPILSNREYGVAESSCLHDWLYTKKGVVNFNTILSRKQVDTIFRHELCFYKINYFIAYAAYYVIRIFGRNNFNT